MPIGWRTPFFPRRVWSGFVAAAFLACLFLAAPPPGLVAASDGPPQYLRTLGGPNHAEMYPSGMEIAPDGSIVIANTGDNAVAKYAPNGSLQWRVGKWGGGTGEFGNPRDVGVDSAGNIYVADTRNHRVVKLSPTGQWLGSWRGPSGDQLSWPMGLSVTGDHIYVADTARHRVRVFDTSGALLHTIQSNGSCQFSGIRDVDADSDGVIYVANYTGNNILKMTTSGACLLTWGSTGTGPGQFRTPYGVRLAVDPVLDEELVYVSDALNNRVQVFRRNGEFVAMFGSSGQPTQEGTFTTHRRVAVATDGSGDVWGADLWGYRVVRFARTASGFSYAQTIGAPPPAPTSSAVFHEARGMAFGADGSVYVANTVHHNVVRMTPDGVIQGTCGRRGSAPGEFNWPRSVAVDPVSGELWVADTKQFRIQILRPDCGFVTRFGVNGTGDDGFDWPYDVTIRASDRTAWIADTRNHRLKVYNVATRELITTFGSRGAGSGRFNQPAAVAINPANGNIFVADSLNNRIVELSSGAGMSISVVRNISAGLLAPEGVAVDDEGRIYVADSGNSRVVVLSPSGTVLTTFDGPDGMDGPEGLAIDSQGRLHVADTYNDRVQVYESMSSTPDPGPDTTPPTVTVSTPQPDQTLTGSPVVFDGNATDDQPIASVRVAIRHRDTLQWWQPTGGWGGFRWLDATLSNPGAATTGWSYTWNHPGPGPYALWVRADDAAGNPAETFPWVPFSIGSDSDPGPDTTPPTVTVSTPQPDQTLTGSPVVFDGNATDDQSIASVRVAIRHRDTLQWWQPTGGWGGFRWLDATLSNPGAATTGWSYAWNHPGPGPYALWVRADDAAGNPAETFPWVPFSVGG